jgi:hypothetical protein
MGSLFLQMSDSLFLYNSESFDTVFRINNNKIKSRFKLADIN